MTKDQSIQKEAKRLVREFKKNQEKGEFRNKLGRIWWPIWNRFVVPGACLCGILSGTVPGIIGGIALFGVAYPITKGFSINVQNIAIKNASLLGRSLKEKQISDEIRKETVLEYLRQSGSLFFNKKWIKEHPQDIEKMVKGQKGNTIPNAVALAEYQLTRAVNFKAKRKEKFSLRERLKVYQQIYRSNRNLGPRR